MQALVTLTRASVGWTSLGSGTVSTRTSPAAYITVAFIVVSLTLEDFLGHGHGGDRTGPPRVESEVRDRFDDLLLGDAVVACADEVWSELIGPVHGDQCTDRHQAPIARRQLRARPHVAEQHVVGELDELGREVADQALGRRGLPRRGGRRGGGRGRSPANGTAVLLVGDLLHPVRVLAVELLHDRDV